MSFRTKLTSFFVLIVVVPMIALGLVVARLLDDSERGKVAAANRASATAALALYDRAAADGARAARRIAADAALATALRTPGPDADATAAVHARVTRLAATLSLARVRIVRAGRAIADHGHRHAVAPGVARLRLAQGGAAPRGGPPAVTIEAATLTAERFARAISTGGVAAVVRRGGAVLATTRPQLSDQQVAATFRARDFGGARTTVTVATDTSAAVAAASRGRTIAVGLLGLFLVLAFAGALLISRQLHGQLARFLAAAKRVGRGDFSATVPVEGGDEFAALGREFNKMSGELAQHLRELDQERERLRESIQRVGATFASNLDRSALLEIGIETIADAVQARCGRATVPIAPDRELIEAARVGDVEDAEPALASVEQLARDQRGAAAVTADGLHVLAAPIVGPDTDPADGPHGFVSVARAGRPFGPEERDLVASLARQTGISLENVELHDQIKRQAVTDELTGLFNHRRFQEVISAEAAASRRFDQPLGLLMTDIDNFKRVNDTYGHQQGDLVLREVAAVLRACSREVDEPARYGGEEMAVALQQTDLAGAERFGERVRTAVEALEVPRLDGEGVIRITLSCGVASSTDGDKDALIAAADAALYTAKRSGKNCTICAGAEPARPVG